MNFLRRLSIFEVSIVIFILGIHLYAALADAYAFPNIWFRRDDAYYYFKVAENITEGHGSTFDGINPTNGYHPLWMLVCIPIFALARFDVILPLRVMLMVIAGIQAITVVLLYRLVKNNLSPPAAILTSMFWAFNMLIHNTVYEYGLETPIAALSIVLLIHKLSQFEMEWRRSHQVSKQKIFGLGLIAVVALFSRLDLVFLAITVGIWIIFRGKPIRFLLPLDLAAFFISMTCSVALRTGIAAYNTTYVNSAVNAALVSMVVKVICLYFFGAYQHPRSGSIWRTMRLAIYGIASPTIILSAVYLVLNRFGTEVSFPRTAFLVDMLISLGLVILVRLTAYVFGENSTKVSQTPLDQLKANGSAWLTEGTIYYGVVGGCLSLYMIFNKLMFGTWTPISGEIKRWWGTIPNSLYDSPASNWYSFLGISPDGPFNAWQPLTGFSISSGEFFRSMLDGADKVNERYLLGMAGLLIIWFIVLFLNRRKALDALTRLAFPALIAASVMQVFSYTATAYGGAKEWYWVEQLLLVTLAASLALDFIANPLKKIKNNRATLNALALLLGLLMSRSIITFIFKEMRHQRFPSDIPSMEVVGYLEQKTPPGSIIGMTGGGNVGYFIHDRTIVNMDGLINGAAYLKALKANHAPSFLFKQGMTIIFSNPQLLSLPPYYDQFAPYLEKFDSYGGKGLLYLLETPKY